MYVYVNDMVVYAVSMRFFKEFGHGDVMLSSSALFTMADGMFSTPLPTGFEREKLLSLFSEEQLQQFFSSRFWRRIKSHVKQFEYEDLFHHRLPGDNSGRIILGVIRNHDVWWNETKYDAKSNRIVYIGETKSPIEIAKRLFASSDDPLPQEVISVAQRSIGFSQFVPMLQQIDPMYSEPELLSRSFESILSLRFGGRREYNTSYADNIWIPTALSMIVVNHVYKEIEKHNLDKGDILAWVAAMELGSFRMEGKDLPFLLQVIADQKLTPAEYLEMLYTSKHKGEEMYNLWTNDIDDTLWSKV